MMRYVERMRYGRYVAKTNEDTISGAYYSFRTKTGHYIGGKHNYRIINMVEYYLLSINYWGMRTFNPMGFKRLIDKSWKK